MFSKSLVFVGWENPYGRVDISVWEVPMTIREKMIDSTGFSAE